ncbi:hypothetical protein ACIBCT_37555 [Streptosporangium sp. NPDC050855]|uniref:hypothetical protein n=1 Tax=Streptosporangium sp. NPDC050855 TaxID=3366194 RepID=UPI0037A08F16
MADSTEWDNRHQEQMLDLADALGAFDAAALARLGPEDRAVQVRARRALWLYADALWDAVKEANPEGTPATRNPFNSVAALRDFTQELYATAAQAQADAGEDEPDERDPIPALPPMPDWRQK